MITINIAKDFTDTPGFRYYTDGPFSGEEFFDKLLKIKFQEAKDKDQQLKIILDGVNGFTTSFLNESFRRLGEAFGSDQTWNRLIIVSNNIPKYIEKIKSSLYEKK
jgi:phosphomannomutase